MLITKPASPLLDQQQPAKRALLEPSNAISDIFAQEANDGDYCIPRLQSFKNKNK